MIVPFRSPVDASSVRTQSRAVNISGGTVILHTPVPLSSCRGADDRSVSATSSHSRVVLLDVGANSPGCHDHHSHLLVPGSGERPGSPLPQSHGPERSVSVFSRRCLTPVRGSEVARAATVAAIVPLCIYASRKEEQPMARVTPITARNVDLLMDLQEKFHELASRDGTICTSEAEVAALISLALAKAERIDRTRRIARNLEDSGEMTPWALRNVREMEADLANVIHIEDYRHENSIA